MPKPIVKNNWLVPNELNSDVAHPLSHLLQNKFVVGQAKRATCTDFLQKEEPFATFCNYLNPRQPDLMQEGFDSWVVTRNSPFAANDANQVSRSTKFEYYKKVVAQISQAPRNLHWLSTLIYPNGQPRLHCLITKIFGGIAWRTSERHVRNWHKEWGPGYNTSCDIRVIFVHFGSLPINRHEMLCREQLRWKNVKLFYPTGKVFAVSPVSDLIITRITLMNQGKDRNL